MADDDASERVRYMTGGFLMRVNRLTQELEPGLKGVFSSLTRVAAPPSPEEAQLVLLPRIADVNVTTASMAFSNREMVIVLEWTVKDSSGKTVWIETVQGTAKHHMGNMFTFKKNQKLIVTDSVKDAAAQSATKRKLPKYSARGWTRACARSPSSFCHRWSHFWSWAA